jgi:hypothetical protein
MAYDIFLSYRRQGGYETTKHLYDLLTHDNYSVSFDIDTLRNGDFDVELLKRIDECTDFILILNEGALDRCFTTDKKWDWLRNELAYALEKNKNIIPVMLDGFREFPKNLPEDIAGVAYKNGPKYDKYYFDDFYRKLKRDFLETPPPKVKGKRSLRSIVVSMSIAVAVMTGILIYYAVNQPFTATVQVYGWEGKGHNPLESGFALELRLGDKPEKAEITHSGEAVFRGVPAAYNHKAVPVRLVNNGFEPYYLLDSALVIGKNEVAALQVSLRGLEKLEGFVTDENGAGLKGAVVRIGDLETLTDARGYFRLEIPLSKQRRIQSVEIVRDGYRTYFNNMLQMVGGDECRVLMERIND